MQPTTSATVPQLQHASPGCKLAIRRLDSFFLFLPHSHSLLTFPVPVPWVHLLLLPCPRANSPATRIDHLRLPSFPSTSIVKPTLSPRTPAGSPCTRLGWTTFVSRVVAPSLCNLWEQPCFVKQAQELKESGPCFSQFTMLAKSILQAATVAAAASKAAPKDLDITDAGKAILQASCSSAAAS